MKYLIKSITSFTKLKKNNMVNRKAKFIITFLGLITITSCVENSINDTKKIKSITEVIQNDKKSIKEIKSEEILIQYNNYQKIKLSKGVNTRQNEYYPVPNADGSILYFVGMDRTGQFSTKIDFTNTRNYGGEDIWYSKRINGIYTKAKPLENINDNYHQSITSINGDFIFVYGIYEETYRVDASGTGAEFYNGDIFKFNLKLNKIEHLGQPINSIFFESDAYITESGNTLLFVTDNNPINGP